MRLSRTLAVVLLAGLVGCAVGPEYAPPEPTKVAPPKLDTTENLSAAKYVGITLQPIRPDWWNAFGDDKLSGLVSRAVAGNLELKIAEARVREARALRGLAAAALAPQVGFGSSGPGGGVGLPGVGGNYSVSSQNWKAFGFDASWEIDVFGGVRRSVQAADADAQAVEEARRDTLVSLLGEIGRNYVELRGAQRRFEIAQANIAVAEKTLEFVTTRRQTGLAGELEVRQAAGQLETVRAMVPGLETAVRKAVFRLSVLVGKEPAALLNELSVPGPIPAAPPEVPTGLPSELLTRRPDIRAAERQWAAASARVGVAVSDRFPKFALVGAVSLGGYYAGPSVKWPIFDGGRIANNIRAADARLEQANLAYQATVLTALEDVELSLTAYAQEQVRRLSLSRAVAEAERAVTLAEQQYKDGIKDFLVVLDAQRTLYAARSELVLSEQSALVNLVAVYKALGGGWDQFEPLPLEPGVKPAEAKPAEVTPADVKPADVKPAEPKPTEPAK